jgi:hypothetical protein
MFFKSLDLFSGKFSGDALKLVCELPNRSHHPFQQIFLLCHDYRWLLIIYRARDGIVLA